MSKNLKPSHESDTWGTGGAQQIHPPPAYAGASAGKPAKRLAGRF
jgi:hypothetical protein